MHAPGHSVAQVTSSKFSLFYQNSVIEIAGSEYLTPWILRLNYKTIWPLAWPGKCMMVDNYAVLLS